MPDPQTESDSDGLVCNRTVASEAKAKDSYKEYMAQSLKR